MRDDWLADRQRRSRTFTQAAMFPAWFAFAIVFVNVAAGALLDGVSHGFDDLYYHAVPVADWITSGHLFTSPALGVHGFFPKGAELLTLWFVLPFHQDAYASLAATYWLLVILLATFVLVGRTRATRRSRWSPARCWRPRRRAASCKTHSAAPISSVRPRRSRRSR